MDRSDGQIIWSVDLAQRTDSGVGTTYRVDEHGMVQPTNANVRPLERPTTPNRWQRRHPGKWSV